MDDELYDQDEMEQGESFAEMFEKSLSGVTRLELGQQTEAKILQIGAEWAFLDVGQKGEGVLDVRELQDDEGNLTVAVGDKIKAYFMSQKGGELRFSMKIGGGGSGGTEQLEEAWRSGIPVDGRIEKEVKGGFEVKLPGNVRAFCPFSQLGLRRQSNPEEMIGTSFSFKITQFEEQGRNIVVSHRVLLEEEREVLREELKQTLKEGMLVKGVVTSIRDFGAFVDIGGIEGLLPISELAYGRVEDVGDVVAEGEELELVIKRIDWEENKFSFSLRDTLADPWNGVADKYKAGTKLTGKISRLAPFGAFVTLEPGIDGLVHISRLGEGKHIKHPQEVVKVGDALPVTVEKVDLEAHRISLIPTGTEEETGETSYSDEPASGSGMGSFADLLKAAQNKKKK
ncbi:MAG: 30S ribosomal protein S1 [Desulfuromonadales bacterium]|nr:30S ribosomal protein S1 [Desulfuromonadales bacterium]